MIVIWLWGVNERQYYCVCAPINSLLHDLGRCQGDTPPASSWLYPLMDTLLTPPTTINCWRVAAATGMPRSSVFLTLEWPKDSSAAAATEGAATSAEAPREKVESGVGKSKESGVEGKKSLPLSKKSSPSNGGGGGGVTKNSVATADNRDMRNKKKKSKKLSSKEEDASKPGGVKGKAKLSKSKSKDGKYAGTSDGTTEVEKIAKSSSTPSCSSSSSKKESVKNKRKSFLESLSSIASQDSSSVTASISSDANTVKSVEVSLTKVSSGVEVPCAQEKQILEPPKHDTPKSSLGQQCAAPDGSSKGGIDLSRPECSSEAKIFTVKIENLPSPVIAEKRFTDIFDPDEIAGYSRPEPSCENNEEEAVYPPDQSFGSWSSMEGEEKAPRSSDATLVRQIIFENQKKLLQKPPSLRRSLSEGHIPPEPSLTSPLPLIPFQYHPEQPKVDQQQLPSPSQASCCTFSDLKSKVFSSEGSSSCDDNTAAVIDKGWYRSYPPPPPPPLPPEPSQRVYSESPSPRVTCLCFRGYPMRPNTYVSCQDHLSPYEYQDSNWSSGQDMLPIQTQQRISRPLPPTPPEYTDYGKEYNMSYASFSRRDPPLPPLPPINIKPPTVWTGCCPYPRSSFYPSPPDYYGHSSDDTTTNHSEDFEMQHRPPVAAAAAHSLYCNKPDLLHMENCFPPAVCLLQHQSPPTFAHHPVTRSKSYDSALNPPSRSHPFYHSRFYPSYETESDRTSASRSGTAYDSVNVSTNPSSINEGSEEEDDDAAVTSFNESYDTLDRKKRVTFRLPPEHWDSSLSVSESCKSDCPLKQWFCAHYPSLCSTEMTTVVCSIRWNSNSTWCEHSLLKTS